jgi:hypothetical protein
MKMTEVKKQFPQVRVTHAAYEHLRKIVEAAEDARGVPIPMSTYLSELILDVPNKHVRRPSPTMAMPSARKSAGAVTSTN